MRIRKYKLEVEPEKIIIHEKIEVEKEKLDNLNYSDYDCSNIIFNTLNEEKDYLSLPFSERKEIKEIIIT